MITPEAPPASEATVSVHAQLQYKGTVIVAASLILIIVFILANMLTATFAPAFTNNSMPSILALHALNCDGDTPGFCPIVPL